MRTAARIDKNQPEIVKALRARGVSVWIIKWPVDLVAGFGGRSVLLEVKDPRGDWRLTDDQKKFFAEFKGEAYIVEDIGQAIKAVCG